MTVSEVIEELKKLPGHMPVKVLTSTLYGSYNEAGEFVDDMVIDLNIDDAIEADKVIWEGNYVLIESK